MPGISPLEKAQRHLQCKKYVEFEARIKGHENIIKEYEAKQEKSEDVLHFGHIFSNTRRKQGINFFKDLVWLELENLLDLLLCLINV
jgi:hypothetical protein